MSVSTRVGKYKVSRAKRCTERVDLTHVLILTSPTHLLYLLTHLAYTRLGLPRPGRHARVQVRRRHRKELRKRHGVHTYLVLHSKHRGDGVAPIHLLSTCYVPPYTSLAQADGAARLQMRPCDLSLPSYPPSR